MSSTVKTEIISWIKTIILALVLAAALGVGYLAYTGTLMKLVKLAVTVEQVEKPAEVPAPAAPAK